MKKSKVKETEQDAQFEQTIKQLLKSPPTKAIQRACKEKEKVR